MATCTVFVCCISSLPSPSQLRNQRQWKWAPASTAASGLAFKTTKLADQQQTADSYNDAHGRSQMSWGVAEILGRSSIAALITAALCFVDPALAFKGGGPYGAEVTRGADLSGKDFSGKNLIQQDFKTSILRQANFKGAKLLGASFFDADLTDVGPVPPADYVVRSGRAMVVVPPPAAVLPPQGRGFGAVPPPQGRGFEARGRGAGPRDDAVDGVRETLGMIVAGFPEDGWRDLDRDIVERCFKAPREWRSILLRAAVMAAELRDRDRRDQAGPAEGRIRLRDDPAGPSERRVRARHDLVGPAEEAPEEPRDRDY